MKGSLKIFPPKKTTWNAKCPIFLGNLTPKTSNYCLKNRALGFPGNAQKFREHFFWVTEVQYNYCSLGDSAAAVTFYFHPLGPSWRSRFHSPGPGP